MKCIIIDDEPLAREGIEKYVAKIDFLENVGAFENALSAQNSIQTESVDLMFLDISMPYLTGIDFLKSLKNPPLVIFQTAYPNFALEGYQLDIIDYLVKPITFERFHKAVSKAYDYWQLKNKPQFIDSQSINNDFIFIKCDKRYEKVMLAEILYVEAMQNYSMVYTAHQKLMTLQPLKSFEESLLPISQFMRVQKSFIVNLNKIESIMGNEIKVGNKMITVGRPQKEEIFNRLVSKKS
ncbi:MAG: LytTR family DNA-binding domain-containing protein [Microscillaceae bacterium]|jgi:DNA-binding LytR/AlgR family response regulator|nr:LytTR family DNA-binding domain-containing protein [Microscillaceae bacterium]